MCKGLEVTLNFPWVYANGSLKQGDEIGKRLAQLQAPDKILMILNYSFSYEPGRITEAMESTFMVYFGFGLMIMSVKPPNNNTHLVCWML